MKKFLCSLVIAATVASSVSAQQGLIPPVVDDPVTLPNEPTTLALCTGGGGGAAALSALNPGLGVLLITFCLILVEDIKRRTQ